MKSNLITRFILIISIISLLIFGYKTLKPSNRIIEEQTKIEFNSNKIGNRNNLKKEQTAINEENRIEKNHSLKMFSTPLKTNSIYFKEENYSYNEDKDSLTNQIKTFLDEEFKNLKDNLDTKIDNQTQLINQIATEIKENNIQQQKAKKLAFELAGNFTELPDSLSYFYNAILYNNQAKTEAYKLNQQISFHIDFLYKLDKMNYSEGSLLKSENQAVNTIKTRDPMKYAVIHFESNIGQIYKNRKEITTDTIRLNMLNFDYNQHSRSLNYVLKINNENIENKTETHIDTHIDYYGYDDKKYFISQNQKLTLYVFPDTNLDYLSMKFDESMKSGIDKLFYLITSIIGLIITATLNFVKKKLHLPAESQNT